MNRTIEITVLRDGQTKVETKGFTGAECRQASQFLERALGQTTGEQLTAEFHQQSQHQQALQEGGIA
jgi:hypothetical protein